jgi:hypothetical protein
MHSRALLLLAGLAAAHGTWVSRDTLMNLWALPLRSPLRPDRALDYAALPMCGDRSPRWFSFDNDHVSRTPMHFEALRDASDVRVCTVDVTGNVWRALETLARDQYYVVLDLDGLQNLNAAPSAARGMNRGYIVARPHPLSVAAHIDVTVQYVRGASNASVQVVNWRVRPVYKPLLPGAMSWTYSVRWQHVADNTPRNVASASDIGTHVKGMQYAGIILCFACSIALSVSMNLTVRRFVAPYMAERFLMFSHINCAGCAQLRGGRFRDAEEAGEELHALVDVDMPAHEASWRTLIDDVFREPRNSGLLTVASGMGLHMLFTTLLLLFLCACGAHAHVRLLMWACGVVAAVPAGYVASMLNYDMQCARVQANAIVCSVAAPTSIASIALIVNAALQGEHSAYAMEMNSAVWLLLGWLAFTVPCMLLGFVAYRYRVRASPHVASVSKMQPAWDVRFGAMIALHGTCVWLGIATSAYTVINTVWMARTIQLSSTFTLLFVSVLMWLFLVCSLAVTFTYICLRRGVWAWAPMSFGGAAFSAVPCTLLFIVYYTSNEFVGATGQLVFACQALAAICTVSFGSAAVSLATSSMFVKALYGSARAA